MTDCELVCIVTNFDDFASCSVVPSRFVNSEEFKFRVTWLVNKNIWIIAWRESDSDSKRALYILELGGSDFAWTKLIFVVARVRDHYFQKATFRFLSLKMAVQPVQQMSMGMLSEIFCSSRLDVWCFELFFVWCVQSNSDGEYLPPFYTFDLTFVDKT